MIRTKFYGNWAFDSDNDKPAIIVASTDTGEVTRIVGKRLMDFESYHERAAQKLCKMIGYPEPTYVGEFEDYHYFTFFDDEQGA